MFADLRACTFWISGYTYIFRHPSNEWWCSNAGQCSNSICDCHQWASIIWTQVQWIDFHTGIECAHKTHSQCKPNDNQSSIATSIWSKYNAEGRNDSSYKDSMKYSKKLVFATEIYVTFRSQILTNSREPFTCASNWAAIPSDQVIAKETSRYGYHPHHQVRNRWENTILFDWELHYVTHVFGQIADHNIEAPIVADLQIWIRFKILLVFPFVSFCLDFYLCAYECNHWNTCQNRFPWSRWQIIITLQLSHFILKIFTFIFCDEWMCAWITVANHSLKNIETVRWVERFSWIL